jgi:hypothetical protein
MLAIDTLHGILDQVAPRFGLDLFDPLVQYADENLDGSGGVHIKEHSRFKPISPVGIRGLDFRIGLQLAETPTLATGFFAHECSHLVKMQRPFPKCLLHLASGALINNTREYLIASGALQNEQPVMLDLAGGAGNFIRCLAVLPAMAYYDAFEREVDELAVQRGFGQEIAAVRELMPIRGNLIEWVQE